MRIGHAWLWMLFTLAGSACGGARLGAQESNDRIDCKRLAAQAATRSDAAAYREAVGQLVTCPTAGGDALAAQWKQPPADPQDLSVLAAASGRLQDERVYRAVSAVAADPTRSQPERLAALNALVGQYAAGLSLRFTDESRPNRYGSEYVQIAVGFGDRGTVGSQPPKAGTTEEVLELLSRLGGSDPDARVRAIAQYLAKRLPQYGEAS